MDERAASDDGALGSDPVPGGPLRVLLAEDNAINALLARNLLERAGCVVDVVGNGRAAVERVARHAAGGIPIDIVLMDVHMPEMSGLEAAAAIGRIAPAHGCSLPPIVALTANAFAEDRKRCLDAGMVDYLAKPFDVSDLAGVLRRWSPRRSGPSERRPAGDAA